MLLLAFSVGAVGLGTVPQADAKPEPAAKPMAAANPAPADTIKVGIIGGMFKGIPDGLIKAGGAQFGGLFQQITGLPGEVQVEEEYRELAKKLNNNTIQLGVVHGFEWAWLIKNNPNLKPLVITIPTKMPQACIVVSAKNMAAGPEGLKGANLDIPFNMKAHGFLHLDKVQKSCPKGSFCPQTPEDLGPEEALDHIAKGKAVAALVDASTVAAYQGNNPGKAAALRVLCTSEVFPPTTLIYNAGKNGLNPKTVDQLQKGLLSAAKNPQGKAFLFLWNLKGFEEPTATFEKLVEDSLKAYPPPQAK
jgi:ABC-type phosphate/phosphonate transport system substrate-binding protein